MNILDGAQPSYQDALAGMLGAAQQPSMDPGFGQPIGGFPPHWLGPPVQQIDPGFQAPPLGQMLGVGPRLQAPKRQGEDHHNPHRAAAMVEMGKFFQAHGKMLQAQQKAAEARGTMKQAMDMASGKNRY